MPFFWPQWYQSGSTGIASGAAPAPSGTLQAPARRWGPETRLPQWILARWAASGLMFGLLQTAAEAAVPLIRGLRRGMRDRFLPTVELADDRLEWRLPRALSAATDLVITVTAASLDGPVGGTLRRAISAAEYQRSPDPVWWWAPETGLLTLRNLHMKQIQQVDGFGVYTIGGESRALVPDAGLYYRRHPSQEWEWLDPASPAVSGTRFRLPASGVWQIAYGSLSALEGLQGGTATLAWPGGQTIPLPLTLLPPDNRFDHWGGLLQLPRLRGPGARGASWEDDRSYRARMLLEVAAPPDATVPGVSRGIAGAIGTLAGATWDGLTPLTFTPPGNITSVWLPGLPELREVAELLSPLTAGLAYAATYPDWRPGWQVFAGGVPAPTAAVSGSTVTFGTAVSGQVSAIYSVRQWSLTRGLSGEITGIVPGTGIPSGSYTLLLSRDVRLSALDLPEVQRDRLLLADGTAAPLFAGIAETVAQASRSRLGRSRWGQALWLPPADAPVSTAHLPLPFDLYSLGPSGVAH